MKTLKRSGCAVLSLVLKYKWYDMIERGEKREEYREKKPYWETRLVNLKTAVQATHVRAGAHARAEKAFSPPSLNG